MIFVLSFRVKLNSIPRQTSCPESKCSAVFSTLWSEWNLDGRTNYLLQVPKACKQSMCTWVSKLPAYSFCQHIVPSTNTSAAHSLSLSPPSLLKEGKQWRSRRHDCVCDLCRAWTRCVISFSFFDVIFLSRMEEAVQAALFASLSASGRRGGNRW
jgi:hypothetical protein